jgi:hypothetical protein
MTTLIIQLLSPVTGCNRFLEKKLKTRGEKGENYV